MSSAETPDAMPDAPANDAPSDGLDALPIAEEAPPPPTPEEIADTRIAQHWAVARDQVAHDIMQALRAEYTVMPRFGFHQPLDYDLATLPPVFDPPVSVPGVDLPLPPPAERMGYSADDAQYLAWGRYDRDLILERIQTRTPLKPNMRVLDFGCSSGRVLRHFEDQHRSLGWALSGVDVQARPIEWMRQHFPAHFQVFVGNTIPHLPFEDNTFDVIYGFSVFTHIKYQWDAWILELRRILRPGGIFAQTIHTENAWDFYVKRREEAWVQAALPARLLDTPEMDVPFLYHGDIGVSQVFWKSAVASVYFGRYLRDVVVHPPAEENSFQDMVVGVK
jgi:SAM-dependent methyltransferase